MAEPTLQFTGERFTPECVREIWYEHLHRYAFASALAAGKRVLDAACGEGYGSALLADTAAEVLGVDIAAEVIDHARARYAGRAGLRFEQASVAALDALPAASFDLICSFETLEHVDAATQRAMLDGFVRLLAPGGLLLISTPDRHNYTDVGGSQNEFHVCELYRNEFEALLATRFAHHDLWAQKLAFQSLLWREAPGAAAGTTLRDGALRAGLDYPALYWLAVCSQSPLPALPAMHLFGDAEESVYSHYNGEVRRNMSAGYRIQELEREVAQLQQRLADLQARG